MTAITIQERQALLREERTQDRRLDGVDEAATAKEEHIFPQQEDGDISKQKQEARGGSYPTSFQHLVACNRPFRLFLLSFMLARMGGWLTYIASISLVEETLTLEGRTNRSAVSVLVAVRFLPIVLLSPVGGALADGHDKRRSMIWLDVVGAACPLLFLFAVESRSIPFVYAITLLQMSVTGLYEPCRSSLTPLLVFGEDELKTAVTLLGLCWSVFAALGSSLGGLIVSSFGLRACFVVDCVTYLASAGLLWMMGGEWRTTDQKEQSSLPLCDRVKDMTVEGIRYLRSSSWGALVFLKASGGVIGGASDILNVAFSEETPGDSALHLGFLFACIGIGAFVGSSVANASTDLTQPSAVQKAAIGGLALSVLACLGTGLFHPFWSICSFTILRAVGTSLNWINSTVLIQKFSAPSMLGRVSAVDGALGLVSETSSALLCGFLQDHVVDRASDVSLIAAAIGACFVGMWSIYHQSGGGAASAADTDARNSAHCTEESPLLSDTESEDQLLLSDTESV